MVPQRAPTHAMRLPTVEYPFVFLTACFSGTWKGREATESELRVPAIRGHLRLWHRVLFQASDANRVWGNAAGNEGSGSRVGITLKNLPTPSNARAMILPHKPDGKQGPRAALPANTKATLVLQRLPNCAEIDWTHAQRTVQLWRLLGSLGYRANRAAGSVWPDVPTAPADPASLRRQIADLGCQWAINLAPANVGNTWELLRKAASDTPSDHINYGSANNPRNPSPTHFKVVRLGAELRLIVFAATTAHLASAKASMIAKPMPALSKPKDWVAI